MSLARNPRLRDACEARRRNQSHPQVLTVGMPFHLPSQKKPYGPSVVPVVCDEGGVKKIRLTFPVGADFAEDDLAVTLDESRKCLTVEATYEAFVGPNDSQVESFVKVLAENKVRRITLCK